MKCISMTLAAATVALFASTASAQSTKPISLGISGGAAIPIGDYADVYNTGYNGTISLALNSVGTPLGLRVDGMYNNFPGRDDLTVAVRDNRIVGANANLVYALPGTGIRPYLIGGGGVYSQKLEGSNAESFSDAGVNGGLGAAFPLSGFNTFIEGRFHHIFSEVATQMALVTFGISF